MLHFLQFFFAPLGAPWYTGAVWGNVVAIIPTGALAWFWSRAKLNLIKLDVGELHRKHEELMTSHQQILDALDTSTPGGLSDVVGRIEQLENA